MKSVKRTYDVLFSIVGLILASPVILLCIVLIRLLYNEHGLFSQERVGRGGKIFVLYKMRTMSSARAEKVESTVTTKSDIRITKLGYYLRRSKLDELPQLYNVVMGDMSLVGPRPDVPGFADLLEGDDRIILEVRPGITGPAQLEFRDEESLLSEQENPEEYNMTTIWPRKVEINRDYVKNWSFLKDFVYVFKTVLGV